MLRKTLFLILACALSLPALASRIVYLAEEDFVLVRELYLVDLARPGESLKLNKSLSAFAEGVGSFAISPDGSRVVFTADHTAGDPDVFVVDITSPGTWTRLGSLPAGHRELFAKWSPDGSRIAFTASEPTFAHTQLYLVDLANPGSATVVNGPLTDGGAVSMTGFDFTPDGSHLVYTASELERRYELYAVDLAAPGQSVRLNAPGGSVGDTYEGRFHVLPDGERVVYSAVWQTSGMRELHVVSIDAPGIPTTLNAPFQPGGYIDDFAVSPDGRHVAYAADQETDGLSEIYLVDPALPGIATKLSGPVQYGASLAAFTPDGSHVLFAADDARGPDERDLYMVPVDLHSPAVRLNAPLSAGEDIGRYGMSADGTQVAYPAVSPSGYARDLMVARLDAPGSAIRVNGPLPNGTLEFPRPQFSPDGSEVAFIAVESVDESIQELYYANVSAPGSSIKLNGPLPSGGIVAITPHAFEFLPAGAPPTGSVAPGTPASSSGSSGGGATSWLGLVLGLAIVATSSRSRRARKDQNGPLTIVGDVQNADQTISSCT